MHNAYTCMFPCSQKETVHLHKLRISCSYRPQPKNINTEYIWYCTLTMTYLYLYGHVITIHIQYTSFGINFNVDSN